MQLLENTFPLSNVAFYDMTLSFVGFFNEKLTGCSVGGRLGDCQFGDASLHTGIVLYAHIHLLGNIFQCSQPSLLEKLPGCLVEGRLGDCPCGDASL